MKPLRSLLYAILIVSFFSCSMIEETFFPEKKEDEAPEASDDFIDAATSVFEGIGLVFDTESSDPTQGTFPTGMTVAWVTQDVELTITLVSCQTTIATDVLLSGTITITRRDADETATLTIYGVMTTGSGTQVTIDGSASWPAPGGEIVMSDEPFSTSGSITVGDETLSIRDAMELVNLDEEDEDNPPTVANIRFLTAGNYTINATDNGTTWEEVYSWDGNFWDVSSNSTNHSVAVGKAADGSGYIVYSSNFRNWTAAVSGVTQSIMCVEAVGDMFYAGIEGAAEVLVSSDNGATWFTQAISGMTAIYDFASDGSRIIAVGGGRTCYTADQGATTWLDLTDSDSSVSFNEYTIRAVDYFNSHWVMVGKSDSDNTIAVFYSEDGLDWVRDPGFSAQTGYMTSIANDGSDKVIISGHTGSEYDYGNPILYMSSTGGESNSWTSVSTGVTYPIVAAAYGEMGNGISNWMIVSNTGKAYFSTDGTTWIERSSDYGTHGATYVPILP